ncbi:hypothetical protein BV394_07765 [Brevirhabdus pacifica]|uniref:Uncharacterized protein n=1 Tax=Brevirhabdus pacifica TaxID=1267768 RepID=A0A1U7DI07_9RHOB|nr:hypothetical protein [Brevirhabdus pacifica]APX89624.1 hypothetical protein BV394_07765 [Brevirhabdus pacifica]OWU74264.1 hypothetical protein ATO5_14530 [Loktanella sp. 22II-4b]PJJ85704.1 hypothetical protein CLV77_0231 [Brevirhabdus pacifica]
MKPKPILQSQWLAVLPEARIREAQIMGAVIFRGGMELDVQRMAKGDRVVFLAPDGSAPEAPDAPPMPVFCALAVVTSDAARMASLHGDTHWLRDASFVEAARPVPVLRALGRLELLPDPSRVPGLMKHAKLPLSAPDLAAIEALMLPGSDRE